MTEDFDTPTTRNRTQAPKVGRSRQPASTRSPEPPTQTTTAQQEDSSTTAGVDSEKPEFTSEELLAVFDDILFTGEYVEEVTIRGRLIVAFRTRTADETKSISREVDATKAVFATTLDGVRSFLQLQYSLTKYNGTDLTMMKPEEKAAFIGKLPSPVIHVLLNALAKFDKKVFEACQEGESNF